MIFKIWKKKKKNKKIYIFFKKYTKNFRRIWKKKKKKNIYIGFSLIKL